MSLNEQERKTLVDLYISKCYETLDDARISRNQQRWNNTANRLYYALFNAICALFVHDGISFGTHRGIKKIFGKEYVLKGLATQEDATLLSRMETMRNNADYDCTFVATEEIINERFPQVEAMIHRIMMLVNK